MVAVWLIAGLPVALLVAASVVLVPAYRRHRRPSARPAQTRRRVWSDDERRLILERDGWACVQCGATSELEIDHVIPWSRGGADTADNAQVLCRSCNASKGAS